MVDAENTIDTTPGPSEHAMRDKAGIVRDWLPRYTGTPLEEFGEYILLTNFADYVQRFAEWYETDVRGLDRSMPNATADGITMIDFGMGSPNAATVMDLLSAVCPKAALFLGKCGGVKPRAGWATSCCRSRPSGARARRTTICRRRFPRCPRSSCSAPSRR